MNRIQLWFVKRYWKKFNKQHNTEAKMIAFVMTRIFWLASFLLKNFGVFTGIVEQIIKLLVGIVSLTPSRRDDVLIQDVENLFEVWQSKIYDTAQKIVDFYNNFWKKVNEE